MNIEKMAALSNILALVPGGYCAYGTWVLLHPQSASAQSLPLAPSGLGGVLTSLFVAIGLVVAAAVLNLVASRRKHASQTQTAAQVVASAAMVPAAASPIDVEAFFRHTYSGQLQVETERNVRAMIQSRPQGEREEFAIRFIATGLVSVVYDRIWLSIFRSQILALQDLNTKILRKEQVKGYYDAAVPGSPEIYPKYTFAQWLQFLKEQVLVLEHAGETIEITVRGKDFLKFMVHYGYTPDGRQH